MSWYENIVLIDPTTFIAPTLLAVEIASTIIATVPWIVFAQCRCRIHDVHSVSAGFMTDTMSLRLCRIPDMHNVSTGFLTDTVSLRLCRILDVHNVFAWFLTCTVTCIVTRIMSLQDSWCAQWCTQCLYRILNVHSDAHNISARFLTGIVSLHSVYVGFLMYTISLHDSWHA